ITAGRLHRGRLRMTYLPGVLGYRELVNTVSTNLSPSAVSPLNAVAILKKMSDWSMYPVNRKAPGPSAVTGRLLPVWSRVRKRTASLRNTPLEAELTG